jgi:transcription antitermination protein NusB
MRRSDQRRQAAFAIYQQEVTGRELGELLGDAKPFTRALAEGTAARSEELDAAIGAHAKGWTLNRIAPLEKAILRVALFEINHRDDVPAPVAIDEAVSIAGRYCGAGAPAFVNGILSAAAGETSNGGGRSGEPSEAARSEEADGSEEATGPEEDDG